MGPVRGRIRRATAADAATLAGLNRPLHDWHAATYPEVFHAAPDPAQVADWFAAQIADPEVTVYLAGDPPHGYLMARLLVRPANPFSPPARRLMIDQVAVAPGSRRQGNARALFAAAEALARELNASEILLDTWAGNDGAQAAFAALGYAPRRALWRRPL